MVDLISWTVIYINHEYISHLKMRGLMKYSELVLKCDPLFSDLLPDWSRGCSAVPLVWPLRRVHGVWGQRQHCAHLVLTELCCHCFIGKFVSCCFLPSPPSFTVLLNLGQAWACWCVLLVKASFTRQTLFDSLAPQDLWTLTQLSPLFWVNNLKGNWPSKASWEIIIRTE